MFYIRKTMHLTKILLLISLLIFILGGCGGQQGAAGDKELSGDKQAEPVKLRLASTLPVGHFITESCDYFKKLVEERSGGRVIIEHYPSMQLYSDKDLVDVLPRGGVEMANVNYGMWTGLVPEFGILDLVNLIDDPEHSYRVQDDPAVKEIIGEKLEEKGNCVLIGWLGMEARGPLTKKPVRKLEDMHGLKLRAHSEYCTHWFKSLGASPVLMSSSEVYQALQRGAIDGVMSGGTSYIARKFYEVANYAIDNHFVGYGPFALLVNKDIWDKLPPDIQEIMIGAGQEATDFCRRRAHEEEEAAWKKLNEMPEVEVVHLSDEEMKRWCDISIPYQKKVFEGRVGKETAKKLYERIEALR